MAGRASGGVSPQALERCSKRHGTASCLSAGYRGENVTLVARLKKPPLMALTVSRDPSWLMS